MKLTMTDFDTLTDEQLADLARRAFMLGLQDGRWHHKPLTATQVLEGLGLVGAARRKGHTVKVRQVYGAGFDISAMMVRVSAQTGGK